MIWVHSENFIILFVEAAKHSHSCVLKQNHSLHITPDQSGSGGAIVRFKQYTPRHLWCGSCLQFDVIYPENLRSIFVLYYTDWISTMMIDTMNFAY